MDNQRESILRAAKGAVEERVDLELGKVIDNIRDLNTEPKKKRTITLTLEFTPDQERRHIGMAITAKSKLEPTCAIQTALEVGADINGEIIAVEMMSQLQGQIDINGGEQAEAKIFRIAR